MPVSRSHNFAFVHIPKTAGTSIKRALRQLAGDQLELDDRGMIDILMCASETALDFMAIQRVHPLNGIADFPQEHLPAVAVRELIGQRRWNSLFSFTFVRNPWDLVVSTYHFRLHESTRPEFLRDPDKAEVFRRCATFANFVKVYPIMEPGDQIDMIADPEGELIVDFVGRFENLQSDFDAVCEKLGFNLVSLPRLNTTDHRPYREYYTPQTKALVGQFFARSIERFGYEF